MKKIANFFKALFSLPLVRGVVKTLPFGNLAYELADNVNKGKRDGYGYAPHSVVSLVTQFVFLALIIYAFVTKQITVEQVLELFRSTAVGSAEPGSFTQVVDSLTVKQ